MEPFYKYQYIFFYLPLTSSHLHSLHTIVEDFSSNSRLVVDEDDNGKLRIGRIKQISPVNKALKSL